MATEKKSKPRVIKDYEKLEPVLQEQLKLVYPEGYSQFLIEFTNRDGDIVSALPFETDDRMYMIKMSKRKANQIIEDDDDYDDEGNLKIKIKEEYEDKYSDVEYLAEKEDYDVADDFDKD